MGSKIGADKVAAKKLGISYDEYMDKIDAGFRWCTICKSWKPILEFYKSSSRKCGVSSLCKDCNNVRQSKSHRMGPSTRERRIKKLQGLMWCRDCQKWLPEENVTKNGICQKHAAEYARNRYNANENVRMERKERTHARRRNLYPIPIEIQQFLLWKFDGKCAYCQSNATTWDHIVPVAKGGNSTPGNIVPCCVHCNSSKKDMDLFEWSEKKGIDGKCVHPALMDILVWAQCSLFTAP